MVWQFARECKKWLNRLMEGHSRLENMVSVENAVAIKWLRWLGFTFTGVRTNVGPKKAACWQFRILKSTLLDDAKSNGDNRNTKPRHALYRMLFPLDTDHFLYRNFEGDRP